MAKNSPEKPGLKLWDILDRETMTKFMQQYEKNRPLGSEKISSSGEMATGCHGTGEKRQSLRSVDGGKLDSIRSPNNRR